VERISRLAATIESLGNTYQDDRVVTLWFGQDLFSALHAVLYGFDLDGDLAEELEQNLQYC